MIYYPWCFSTASFAIPSASHRGAEVGNPWKCSRKCAFEGAPGYRGDPGGAPEGAQGNWGAPGSAPESALSVGRQQKEHSRIRGEIRSKRSQNLAPVLVIISGNSLAFSRKIITSTGFYWCCAAGASAPVVVKNQSPSFCNFSDLSLCAGLPQPPPEPFHAQNVTQPRWGHHLQLRQVFLQNSRTL